MPLKASSTYRGEKIIRALSFLESSRELVAHWFVPTADQEVENIRVADDMLIDLLFAANGQTFETIQPYIREITVEGTPIKVLNIDGLVKTKTNCREKDLLDKKVLLRIQQGLSDD